MRRLVVPVVLASGLVMIGAGSASAGPAPTATPAKAVSGKKVCKVTDPVLDELSGIVATRAGFVVINDGSPKAGRERIFFLNDNCKITDRVQFSGAGARDTEDLILSQDGRTLWVADIGDNARERGTISVWTMPADGSKQPTIHRFSYPTGDRHDAEALLLNGDGTPIFVTKEIGRPAGVYVPTAPMKSDNVTGVPLKKVGEITVPASTTPSNTIARLGRATIDGGAIAPGGGRVTLRTYTDALEWNVTGGDVLSAIKGQARVTPLPDEPQGEAITYSPDGKAYYTVSDMQGDTSTTDNYILRYTPTPAAVTAKSSTTLTANSKSPSWYSNLGLKDITYLVGGVGLLGALLVGVGIFGIMRSRRRYPASAAGRSGPYAAADSGNELIGVGQSANGHRPAGGGVRPVYGGRPSTPPAGGVYGGQRGSGVYGAPTGGVSGGGRPGSGVYGAPSSPPPPPSSPGRSGSGGRSERGGGGSVRGAAVPPPASAPHEGGGSGRASAPRGSGGRADQRPYIAPGNEQWDGRSGGSGRDYDYPGPGRGR